MICRAIWLLLFLPYAFAAHRDVIARSDFHWGDEDWAAYGPKVEIFARGGMLFGSDKSRKVWYFSAPEAFIGDKCFAHNGELSFKLGHSEYMSNGKDMIRDWDVILESKLWKLRFGVKDIIPPWVGATSQTLSLNEKSWTNMATGHPPTTIEMLRMLTALSGLYIRGGYYDGHEETWIDEVVLREGDHKEDVLLRQIEKHATHPSTIKEKEPEPVVVVEEDLEEVIARRIKAEAEAKRIAQMEAEALAKKMAAELEEKQRREFEQLASEEERKIAKVLEEVHEDVALSHKDQDLTPEEVEYAVTAAEKELVRQMREQNQAKEKEQEKREVEKDRMHEKELEGDGARDHHDVSELHHKAHMAALHRKQDAAEKHQATSPVPDTKSDASYDGDITIEEAAAIQQHITPIQTSPPPSSIPPTSDISKDTKSVNNNTNTTATATKEKAEAAINRSAPPPLVQQQQQQPQPSQSTQQQQQHGSSNVNVKQNTSKHTDGSPSVSSTPAATAPSSPSSPSSSSSSPSSPSSPSSSKPSVDNNFSATSPPHPDAASI